MRRRPRPSKASNSRPVGAASRTLILIAFCILATFATAREAPVCPAEGRASYPAHGPVGGAPNVATWHRTELGAGCAGLPAARPELAVALAGAFRAGGGITDLAARLGAISLTRGLTYWSTTDQRWKVLVSDAHALTAAEGGQARGDFSAAEILSGAPLHFAQDDTRSSGTNVYRLRTLHAEGDRLVFEMTNLTAIRFGFVTLFGPESLVSVHFLERGAAGTWLYYGLSAVTEGFVGDHDGSFINRQDAFYRFLANESPTARPPLAP